AGDATVSVWYPGGRILGMGILLTRRQSAMEARNRRECLHASLSSDPGSQAGAAEVRSAVSRFIEPRAAPIAATAIRPASPIRPPRHDYESLHPRGVVFLRAAIATPRAIADRPRSSRVVALHVPNAASAARPRRSTCRRHRSNPLRA